MTLLDEVEVAVQENGRETVTHRCAIRILNRSGREYAVGSVDYVEPDSRVGNTGAWLVRAGKEIRPADKRQWVDLSVAESGQLASEVRCRRIDLGDLALDGDVFGYETSVTLPMLLPQESTAWGGKIPCSVARCSLRLPPGWTPRAVLDGPLAEKVRPSTALGSWTWELDDLPYRPDEPYMDDAARIAARLFLDFDVPAGRLLPMRKVRSWADLATWLMELQDPQCDTDSALASSVRELTANCPDTVSRLRALSRHVQGLRYVAVDKGVSRGLGMRPRKATEVLAKGWGDCKAKANLLRAMLREIGLESHMVLARIGGGRLLNESWCSPYQFNHAILAIRVDTSVDLPAVLDVPGLGRLLFFDATCDDVLIGDLPVYLQGSKVHVVAAGNDALTTLPVLPAETHHRSDRQVHLSLDASGAVVGTCSQRGVGSIGAYSRRQVRTNSAKELRMKLTERIAATVRGAVLEDIRTADDPLSGESRIDVRFTAARYAQLMPGGLAVVRLDVLSRDGVPVFPAKERKLPIGLAPVLVRDEVVLQLPPGYVVEEMPTKAELSSPYGRYESTYESDQGTVVAHRMLQLEDRTVPVVEYAALKKFLGDVAKADRASVVLRQAEVAGAAVPAK